VATTTHVLETLLATQRAIFFVFYDWFGVVKVFVRLDWD